MLPQLASVAQQAGRHCARNIAAHSKGLPTSAFAYFDKWILAMIGRNAAVAEIGPPRITLTGLIAFIAWLGLHALLLTTLPARVAARFEWVWNYFGGVNVEGILDSPSPSAIEVMPPKSVQNVHPDSSVARSAVNTNGLRTAVGIPDIYVCELNPVEAGKAAPGAGPQHLRGHSRTRSRPVCAHDAGPGPGNRWQSSECPATNLRQGSRARVYIGKDILVISYANHRVNRCLELYLRVAQRGSEQELCPR
jgi:hypothetical protein